jgi:hypothetical protein
MRTTELLLFDIAAKEIGNQNGGAAMRSKSALQILSSLGLLLVVYGAASGCGQASTNDVLYATVPDKLVTLSIHGISKTTTTVVGATGAPGCASLARSNAGVMYSICGAGIMMPAAPQQLATIDLKTGHATLFGQPAMGLAIMGLEFSPDGTLYAVGDTNKASPTFNSLYSVNTTDGTFTRVGSTGAPEFFMDFAFDKNGTMYGATNHTLFTIDTKTGTATKVADFVGGGDVMGLSFDTTKSRLYATDFKTRSI